MKDKTYLSISGAFFGLIATIHLLRIINGWTFQIGSWTFPMWLSWLGIAFFAALSIWGFRLASRH
jgi:hypothetical protein